MSTLKVIDLIENLSPSMGPKLDSKLAAFVARHLKNLRKDYCEAHGITMDQFAERVGVTKKHLYALERGESSPTIDTLNQILQAQDTDLVEFFNRLITYQKLADIELKSSQDRRLIEALVSGLSHSRARLIIEGTAQAVTAFLHSRDVQ